MVKMSSKSKSYFQRSSIPIATVHVVQNLCLKLFVVNACIHTIHGVTFSKTNTIASFVRFEKANKVHSKNLVIQ